MYRYPNHTVPTAPAGTSDNRAASTAFVRSAFVFAAAASNNLIVNVACQVDQEHVGAAVTGLTATAPFIIDQWAAEVNGPTVTAQQVVDGPPGFKNSLKLTVTTGVASPAAGQYLTFNQPIEGYKTANLLWGTANALPIAIGFWIKTHRPGTYAVAIRNSVATRTYVLPFTVNSADTWEYKTMTVPGDTAGAWDSTNAIGLSITITLMSGDTTTAGSWQASGNQGVNGMTNGAADANDKAWLTGCSIFLGTASVPESYSPYIVRPFDQELTLCQRFYEKSYFYADPIGTATQSGAFAGSLQTASIWYSANIIFRVRKRGAPGDLFGSMKFYDTQSGTVGRYSEYTPANAFVANRAMTDGFLSETGDTGFFVNAAAGTPNNIGYFHWVADSRM